MKTVNALIFLILSFFIVVIIFTFLKKNNFFEPVNIGQSIDCYSEKIEDSILNLSAKLKYIDAFISFNNMPLDDNISNSLGELNIELDKRTIIFDYIWSKIPLSNLCDLVELEEVKSVFTLHNK